MQVNIEYDYKNPCSSNVRRSPLRRSYKPEHRCQTARANIVGVLSRSHEKQNKSKSKSP